MILRLLLLSTTVSLLAAVAHAETRMPLLVAAKQADAVVLLQIKGVDQAAVPGSGQGVAAYWRHRFVAVVTRLVVGKGVTVGQSLLVDHNQWRLDLAEHLRCKGGAACQWPDKPALDSQLTRAPREGQLVLALLKQTPDGWQLAVDRGFDEPAAAAALTARTAK